MHVALLANTAWMEEEMAIFRHLVVGLIDEQVRVAQVVPTGIAPENLSAFGDWVSWRDSRWSYMRRWCLSRRATRLNELGVDVVHALDGRLWEGALRLALKINAPAILTSGSALDVAVASRLAGKLRTQRVAIAASTQPLGEIIRQRVNGACMVKVVRAGVHIPDEASRRNGGDRTLSAVISGTGRFDLDYQALFEALRLVIKDEPSAQFFLDGLSSDQHPLWQAARRYGLLRNLSMVPRWLQRRELLLGADMLIHPQALHRARGLTLQAMAHGLPVLARADPWLDYLEHNRTAWVVDAPEANAWYDLIRRVVDRPEEGRRIGEQARQWIHERHRAAQQIAVTLELYREVEGQSLKFPQTR